jgi:hypothetical protein
VNKIVKRQRFIRRHFIFTLKNEADFLRCQEIMEDGHLWPSYEEWLLTVENSVRSFARQGIQAEKIEADPDEFVAWCKVQGRSHDSNARGLFAAFKGDENAEQPQMEPFRGPGGGRTRGR